MQVSYRLVDPFSPYHALIRNFSLIVQMAKRDVAKRYRGSFGGTFWSFFNPLLMLVIYTFVFGVVFTGRWDSRVVGHFQYAIVLFSGLNISTVFTECANKATTLIEENTNYVKRVVFPLEALSWSTLGAALFHLLVSTIALLALSLIVNGSVPWTVVLFPIVALCFTPFMVGVVWLLAAFGVFFRDLKQLVSVVSSALMFVAPILYPMSMIPKNYQMLLYINPLTVIAMASQRVLYFGQMPRWDYLGLYVVASSFFAWAAFSLFQRMRKGFADVI